MKKQVRNASHINRGRDTPLMWGRESLCKLSVSPVHHVRIAKDAEAMWHSITAEILNLVAEHGDSQAQPHPVQAQSPLCTSVAV